MSSKILLSIGFALGVGVIGYMYYRRHKIEQIPKKWRRVGTLASLRLYPVKSCAPLQLQTARTELRCDTLGLRIGYIRDRGMMLVDETGQAVTCNEFPHMQFIETRITGLTRITFQTPEQPPIELDFSELVARIPGEQITVKLLSNLETATGMLVGAQYDKWFSKAILKQDSGLRLIYYNHEQPIRQINRPIAGLTGIKAEDSGTYSDAASYMLINLSSLAIWNAQEEKPVEPWKFRSNFDVQTDNLQPFAEQQWNWIKIGEKAIFHVTGRYTTSFMPIHIAPHIKMGRFSSIFKNDGTTVGILLGLRQPGAIKVNDVVYVEDS